MTQRRAHARGQGGEHGGEDSAGNLWVTDMSHRVQGFNSKGEYLTNFGSAGNGDAK